jgi:mevalonate kinase
MTSSKIILAGEYTILDHSQLIGIPFKKYSGTWKFSDQPDERLFSLYNYIKDNCSGLIDVSRFYKDIASGMYFDSNIPEGYGCGSSGALIAGLYKRYLLKELKHPIKVFSEIESYFHGTSSGLDPYISYQNKAVLVDDKQFKTLDEFELNLDGFYLYDSNRTRNTKNLVQKYKQLSLKDRFEIVQKSNDLVNSLLSGHAISDSIKSLSKIQLDKMKFAIPKDIQDLWEKSFENGIFFKLCGAGGGGYFLVFSTNTINHPDYIKLI